MFSRCLTLDAGDESFQNDFNSGRKFFLTAEIIGEDGRKSFKKIWQYSGKLFLQS
jgi:hypothetical protein